MKKEYNVKKRGIYIGKKKDPQGKTKYGFVYTNLLVVRFADDVVILARSRRMIEKVVRPCLEDFLNERGL